MKNKIIFVICYRETGIHIHGNLCPHVLSYKYK